MTHLLVTNDFPPKVGGIQSYLWELWRRLPPDQVTVLTTAHPQSSSFDADQGFRIVRSRQRLLLPTPQLLRQVRELADEVDAGVVLFDPALPLGMLGPRLDRPYAVILHGAEVTVPARLPGSSRALAWIIRGARHIIAASGYAQSEGRRLMGDAMPPTTLVPPGVDPERFRPLSPKQRDKARVDLGLDPDGCVVVSVSRLVPRKGMDALIGAAAHLAPAHPDVTVAIAGSGRDRARLERMVTRLEAPVRLLGAVPDDQLPALYGCGDVFAMVCRERWGGLDQEGFGIVFLEAAACGVVQVAGASGGAGDAVVDGETGLMVAEPGKPERVAAALDRLLGDPALRRRMGESARQRAETEFSYDVLAPRLERALADITA
ncbi:MAG: glycosyltransferase family 4 protein [Actinomycetota bacterium]|nr:glycosyltransferase family 4 protein [Actinomycetota bacterium]MDQ3680936.1 glycosyltransferase family 4 protein [Actinomycetota bacterium]